MTVLIVEELFSFLKHEKFYVEKLPLIIITISIVAIKLI